MRKQLGSYSIFSLSLPHDLFPNFLCLSISYVFSFFLFQSDVRSLPLSQIRFLPSSCLLICHVSVTTLFVNSVFSHCVKWKVGDTQVQIAQLAMAGEKQRKKAISYQGPLVPSSVGTSAEKRNRHFTASQSARRRLGEKSSGTFQSVTKNMIYSFFP